MKYNPERLNILSMCMRLQYLHYRLPYGTKVNIQLANQKPWYEVMVELRQALVVRCRVDEFAQKDFLVTIMLEGGESGLSFKTDLEEITLPWLGILWNLRQKIC